ncbi:MAG: hypothetical protein SGPRY_000956 [Prymnesium sp.]
MELCLGCGVVKARALFGRRGLLRGEARCGVCEGRRLLCSRCDLDQPLPSFSKRERMKLHPMCGACEQAQAGRMRCDACKELRPASAFSKGERAAESSRHCQSCAAKRRERRRAGEALGVVREEGLDSRRPPAGAVHVKHAGSAALNVKRAGGLESQHPSSRPVKRGRKSGRQLSSRAARLLADADDLAEWERQDLQMVSLSDASVDLTNPEVCSVSL